MTTENYLVLITLNKTLESICTKTACKLFWQDYVLKPYPNLTLIEADFRAKLQEKYVSLVIRDGNEIKKGDKNVVKNL